MYGYIARWKDIFSWSRKQVIAYILEEQEEKEEEKLYLE
jgi:hypothetical protein